MSSSGRSSRRSQLWLLGAEGAAQHGPVADVAVFARSARVYDYAIPAELAADLRPGALLRVPYGRAGRAVDGVCVGISDRPWHHTRKSVLEMLPGTTHLDQKLIELGLWISDYYAAPPGVTFNQMAPRSLRAATRTGRSAVGADPAAGAGEEPIDCPEDRFELTAAQAQALARIDSMLTDSEFRIALLFGVPGSGKTEVYVRSMRGAIARGRQAILILPEIALATQLMERLARRFARVAVLHSQLAPRTRAARRAAIARGEIDVVIGTRSAIFAPFPSLGLIIVDEEQEGSLKSLSAPFYNARDVAIKRGQLEGVPVILGSATPSLESWHNAQTLPHYELIRLAERVPGAVFPRVLLVESTGEDRARILSPPLARELRRTLERGAQAILLHNRRGYAVFLRCMRCGLPVRCDRCGLHMVLHASDQTVRCHRCGKREPLPDACLDQSCGAALERSGFAVQRLEQELREAAPRARLLRLDRDSMRRRSAYEEALGGFARGEADVLFGTQMVAKGLDFPRVALVGVIDADRALSIPDFRSPERVLQLIMQVVGRAGRHSGESLAIVQCVGNPPRVVQLAAAREYERFAAEELNHRHTAFYPPFSRLARLICGDEDRTRARRAAEKLAAELRQLAGRVHSEIRIDPAAECPLPRLRKLCRFDVLIRAPRDGSLQRLLNEARSAKALNVRVERFTIDVDPLDLL